MVVTELAKGCGVGIQAIASHGSVIVRYIHEFFISFTIVLPGKLSVGNKKRKKQNPSLMSELGTLHFTASDAVS